VGLLVGLELFVGYLLLYAGLHQRGRYATDPWGALKVGANLPGSPHASNDPSSPDAQDANPGRENQWA
jgi:hypothetical protein